MSDLWCADTLRQSDSEGSDSDFKDEKRVVVCGEAAQDVRMRTNAAGGAALMSATKHKALEERGTEGENGRRISALVQDEFISSLSFYTTSHRERAADAEEELERTEIERDQIQGRNEAGDTRQNRMAQAQGLDRTLGTGGHERAQEQIRGVDERVFGFRVQGVVIKKGF